MNNCIDCFHLDCCVTEKGENPMCKTDEKEHFLSCEIGDEMAEQDFNEYRSRT